MTNTADTAKTVFQYILHVENNITTLTVRCVRVYVPHTRTRTHARTHANTHTHSYIYHITVDNSWYLKIY